MPFSLEISSLPVANTESFTHLYHVTCRLLDKGSGELLASYQGHVHQAVKLDCCLTPSDAHVVGGSESGEVLYWDLVESEVVKRFTAHGGVVCSLAMHPSGEMLLTSSVDGTMKVWQV